MNQEKRPLKEDGTNISFYCPGCRSPHRIRVGTVERPNWNWNGSRDKPTFTPSILVSRPPYPEADEDFKEFRAALICHSFIIDGKIQFLGDSTHALAGKTVDLPDYDDAMEAEQNHCGGHP